MSDDTQHYRKQLSYYQSLKSCILDEISRQRDLHQRTDLEVEDLKMQKQITIQAHEADNQVRSENCSARFSSCSLGVSNSAR